MKPSRTKFILIFLISAFAFQFASNSLLGTEVRLFPLNGDTYPGIESTIAWKNIVAAIIFPIKIILLAPLSSLFKLPDPAPPILLLAFAAYWTAIAFILHFLITKIFSRKKI